MQKRFPAAGESHIHNALRISRLGDREKRDGAADDMPRFWVAVLGYHSTDVLVNDFRQLLVGSSREARPMGFLDYRLLLSGEDNIVMRTRDRTRKRAPGAQVPVPECVMQKRFPAEGESHIHNALRVSGLGARTTNSAKHYRRIC